MRFVLLALIILTLPAFIGLLRSAPRHRDWAIFLLGFLVFLSGSLEIDAAIISWPLWLGTSRGVILSPVDTLAIALIATRSGGTRALPFRLLFLVFAAVLASSIVYSRLPMASFFSLWDFLRISVAFLAIGGEMTRPGVYPALVKGMAAGLLLQAGFVIEQKLTGAVQATGTMVHQNLLGMLTEVAFLNILALMLEGNKSWLLRFGALAGAIVVAGGGSRGAIAVMGAASGLLIVLSLARRQTGTKWIIAGSALALLAITAPLALMTLNDRFDGGSVVTEESERRAMERAATAMSKDNPLGVGANMYTTVSNTENYAGQAGVSWRTQSRSVPVHNVYLMTRAELGHHGVVAFILLLGVPALAGLVHAFRKRKNAADGYPLGAAVAIIAVMVHSFYEFQLMIHTALLPVVLSIGVIAGQIRASRRRQSHSEDVVAPPVTPTVSDMPVTPAISIPRIVR